VHGRTLLISDHGFASKNSNAGSYVSCVGTARPAAWLTNLKIRHRALGGRPHDAQKNIGQTACCHLCCAAVKLKAALCAVLGLFMWYRLQTGLTLLLSSLGLAAQEPSALDGATAFGARPSRTDMSLSPDGTSIAFIASERGQGGALFTPRFSRP